MEHMARMQLLYKAYSKEMQAAFPEACMDEAQFVTTMSERLEELPCIEIETDGQYAFLYYQAWEDEIAHINVPVFGYHAGNERMMVRLFQKLAEKAEDHAVTEFSICLYCHDHACIQALHMMQFGNMAEKGIHEITRRQVQLPPQLRIRELEKEEIICRWEDVWNAVSRIILHLSQSPVFYKGTEFTQEAYREFILDSSVHVFAAFLEERIVGIIEWNEERTGMLSSAIPSANAGEAFVEPEFRGTGLALQLLTAAQNSAYDQGVRYLWVEHGTANPEARGFWNKYFVTYQYELVRTVTR